MGWIMGLVSTLLLGLTSLAAGGVVVAVNAGGGAYPSAAGLVYQADAHFVGGAPDNAASTIPIVGTADDPLYQTWRWTPTTQFRYAIPVANGDYQVTLKFAENVHNQAGRRRFEVHLEGVQVLAALDVWAAAGGQHRAYDVLLPVTVMDGQLDLAFIRVVGNPMVGAIVVASAAAPPLPAGPGDVTLAWDPVPGATGYRLYASTDLGATWTQVADVATTTATVPALSGLVLVRGGAYNAQGETLNTWSGAWYDLAWRPLAAPVIGAP
ncbi:MAG: malectin domain-containing carbohydrate-binding protein [Candidatus Rokuibacteriota bacterium]